MMKTWRGEISRTRGNGKMKRIMVENNQWIMEKAGRGNGAKQPGDNDENMKEDWVKTTRGEWWKPKGGYLETIRR